MAGCLDPVAPTDEELMCYVLDGKLLSNEAQKHLASCLTCKQQVMLYTRTNAFLTSSLYRSQCPPSTQLADYCAPISFNFLSNDARVQITEHVNFCPLCNTEVVALRHDLNTIHQ